jgi:hypothetical protein
MHLPEAITPPSRISEPRNTIEKKILLNEFVMQCDEAARNTLYHRGAGFSGKDRQGVSSVSQGWS